MTTERALTASKLHPLSNEAIQTLSLAPAAHELYANTTIRAGRHGPTCWADSKAETEACCHAIPNSEAYQIVPHPAGWYCNYADSGSGDWD